MSQLKGRLRSSFRADFPSFVFCFSALTFLLAAFYTLHPRYRLGLHELYALGIILAAALAALAPLMRAGAPEPKLSWREILPPLIIFLFGLSLGLYRITAFSIWLDEELHANVTLGAFGSSFVFRAAETQQMPLSYYFSSLSLSLFGVNELGMRLFSCVFMAGSGVLFYRLAKRICRHPLVYTVAPAIYLLNPWIIRYAQEGRPYGCMIFCGLLWLNAVHDLFTEPGEGKSEREGWRTLLSCTLLFLLSATFQPVIFAASFLPVLGWLLFLRRWRKKALAFCGVVALSILAVLPLIHLARSASLVYLHASFSWGSFERAQAGLLSLFTNVKLLFLDQSAFLALAILLAPITLSRPIRQQSAQLWAGIAGLFIFFIGFLAIFLVFINYPIYVRYYLIAYPLGLIIIIAYFDQVATFFDRQKDRSLLWAWQMAFLAALLVPQIKLLPTVYFAKSFDRLNADHRGLFHYLKAQGLPGDVAYIIPYQDPGEWEQVGFITNQFYFQGNPHISLDDNWQFKLGETAPDLILRDLARKKPNHVYLVFVNTGWGENPIVKYCASRPDTSFLPGDGFLVCELSVKNSLAQSLESFFSGAIQFVGHKEKAYRMFDVLLHLAEHERNPAKCRAHLEELKKLKSAKPRIQKLVETHEALCRAIPARPRK